MTSRDSPEREPNRIVYKCQCERYRDPEIHRYYDPDWLDYQEPTEYVDDYCDACKGVEPAVSDYTVDDGVMVQSLQVVFVQSFHVVLVQRIVLVDNVVLVQQVVLVWLHNIVLVQTIHAVLG